MGDVEAAPHSTNVHSLGKMGKCGSLLSTMEELDIDWFLLSCNVTALPRQIGLLTVVCVKMPRHPHSFWNIHAHTVPLKIWRYT